MIRPFTDEELLRISKLYSSNEINLFLNGRVRELKIELGKKESYILELEDTIKQLKQSVEATKSFKSEVKKEEMYLELKKHLKGLNDNNRKLKKQNSELARQLYHLTKNEPINNNH